MYNKLPNGGIERQIRSFLKEKGYGRSRYDLREVDLVAVERPGWRQIFRFELDLRPPHSDPVHKIGIAFDDHRSHCEIQLLDSESDYRRVFGEWSEGMIVKRFSTNEYYPVRSLLGLCAIIAAVLAVLLTFDL
ncbi:hypothetical protein [Rubinisphaera sp. JC750]|uniref:hypothetical protein n=1 Tax=Rubinisphaera sp. JC750 TaxID=2898658 RepID=UPI001F3A3605|nr:hypothetical protein [Rubinisphaera sp. JC750]